MNYTNIFKKTIFLLIAIGMCVLSYPNNTIAFSKESIDFDYVEPFKINAVISMINLNKAYLIAGEKKILFMEFKVGDKHYKTAFVNQRGSTSYVTSLRTSLWLGERVIVKGLKLPNGDILAGIIKKVPSGHK